jgi:hypothetical protein
MKRLGAVSIQKLAAVAGVGRCTARRWIHGHDVRRGSARLLEEACRTLGVAVGEVVLGVDQESGSARGKRS